MLRVKHFKMQVQKASLKSSFYWSAHTQDSILIYLIPKCPEIPAMTKTLAGNCWGQSGKLDDRGDICDNQIPTPTLHSIPLFMAQSDETE